MKREYTRREFVLAGVNAAFLGALIHGRFIEPFWVDFNTKRLLVPHISRPIRVLHLSDLHVFDTMPTWYFENVMHEAATLEADFAAFTGDFISTRMPDPTGLASLLKIVAAKIPTYAVLGNHDGGSWSIRHRGYETPEKVLGVLHDAGIRALNNESIEVTVQGQRIALAGTTDLWSGPIPVEMLRSGSRDTLSIVLAHNPDTKDVLAREHWHLMLSGHTHGGQVRYPFIGGTPFCVVKDRRFLAGLNPWEGRTIHTSRGVGSIKGIREFCAPEVTVLELHPAAAAA